MPGPGTTFTVEDEEKCKKELLRAARKFGRKSDGRGPAALALEKWARQYAKVYDALYGTKEET